MATSVRSLRLAIALVGATLVPASRPLHAQVGARAVDSAPPHPIQIALTVGTTGVGLEASRLLLERLGLRVGASGVGGTVGDIGTEDVAISGSVRLLGTHALLDLYPFRRASLHLTGGVRSGTTRVLLAGQPRGGQFELNGVTYNATDVGTLRGRISLPRVMPYAGIGFGRPTSYGFRFLPATDIGVGFGTPTTELVAENGPRNARLAADVEAERRKLDDDIRTVPYLPVLTMAFAWRF
jgi:hypothetical protein